VIGDPVVAIAYCYSAGSAFGPMRVCAVLRRMNLFLAAVLLAFAPVGYSAEACIKTVRWELQPPYGVRLEDGSRGGYYADVVKEALRRMGCETRFVDLPWARGLRELQEGSIDIVAGVLATPERAAYARFSRPINLSPNLLFLRHRALQEKQLTQLSGVMGTNWTIGVEASAAYSLDYIRLQSNPEFRKRLHFIPDRARGWRMLATGRIDGLIADEASGLVEGLPMQPSDAPVSAVLQMSAMPAHVALSRVSIDENFVRRLDAAITSMVTDGTMATLRERYIPCKTDLVTLGCQRDAGGLSPAP
jgi:polar amino acid transport system substrate-binding protein